jgi:hypothetical protein
MPLIRRIRGAVLRFVRRRALAVTVGVLLAAPAACVEFTDVAAPWWADGVALVAGATGLALVWTGLFGLKPDWMENSQDGEGG